MSSRRMLYHYCSLSTAIEHILPNKQLLINPVGKSNDPRENECIIFGWGGRSLNPKSINPWKLSEELSREIRENCKQTCFSTNDNKIKGYELSRLWAMYSDNHKGVCLEIDEEAFIAENNLLLKKGYFKNIKYENLNKDEGRLSLLVDFDEISRIGITQFARDFRTENIDFFFFRKNSEWESENEVRLLLISDSQEAEYCSIKDSLNTVILGLDFNKNYLPSIISHLNNIPAKKLSYFNNGFGTVE